MLDNVVYVYVISNNIIKVLTPEKVFINDRKKFFHYYYYDVSVIIINI